MRRTRSKFAPGWSRSPDVQLHPGRNLDIVTQVVSLDAFATDIVSDYGRYTSACAVLETAERLAGEERAPAPALHRLTVEALRAVADGTRPRELVLDAYLLRAMGVAGWAPSLTECARCAATRPAPRISHRCRGQRVHALPPVRVGHSAAAGPGSDGRALRGRLGGSPNPRRHRTAATPAGWSPPTCNGTWNASCGHCRWSSGPLPMFRTASGRMFPMAMDRVASSWLG